MLRKIGTDGHEQMRKMGYRNTAQQITRRRSTIVVVVVVVVVVAV